MNNNKKRIVLLASLLVALVAVFVGVYFFTRPATQKGEKAYTLEVTDKEGATKKYNGRTDAEYLQGLLDEVQEQNKDFSYAEEGGFVNTVNGVKPDWATDQAYWAIYVNGEYGQLGIKEQPVKDGDVFGFVYTSGATY